jgi:hypothetical protein
MKIFAFVTLSVVTSVLCFTKAMALGLTPTMLTPIALVVMGCIILWHAWDPVLDLLDKKLSEAAMNARQINQSIKAAQTVCENHPEEFAAALNTNS